MDYVHTDGKVHLNLIDTPATALLLKFPVPSLLAKERYLSDASQN
jgi:hypothetical protein